MSDCHGEPLLHAWLHLDLNIIPNICVRENIILSQHCGYANGCSSQSSRFESEPDPVFLPCICSFLSLLRTSFVRKYIAKAT